MRDDDDDTLLLAQRLDRPDQRVLAVGIEIGVWLIEHHQEGMAEHGAGKADPFAGRRTGPAPFPEPCVIAVGQAQIISCAPATRAASRPLPMSPSRRTANLCDRAVEQRDILGQIANVAPEIVNIPLIDRRAVEAHDARRRRPDRHQRLGQRRFAGGACAGRRKPTPRSELERNLRDDRFLGTGDDDAEDFDRQAAARPLEDDRRRRRAAVALRSRAGGRCPRAPRRTASSSPGPPRPAPGHAPSRSKMRS